MSEPKRPHSTPEWIMDFATAVCSESPNLLLSTDEKNILTAATQKIRDLEAENKRLRDRLAQVQAWLDATLDAKEDTHE